MPRKASGWFRIQMWQRIFPVAIETSTVWQWISRPKKDWHLIWYSLCSWPLICRIKSFKDMRLATVFFESECHESLKATIGWKPWNTNWGEGWTYMNGTQMCNVGIQVIYMLWCCRILGFGTSNAFWREKKSARSIMHKFRCGRDFIDTEHAWSCLLQDKMLWNICCRVAMSSSRISKREAWQRNSAKGRSECQVIWRLCDMMWYVICDMMWNVICDMCVLPPEAANMFVCFALFDLWMNPNISQNAHVINQESRNMEM